MVPMSSSQPGRRKVKYWPRLPILLAPAAKAAAVFSKAAGMPDIPRVVLPHPVAGTGEARMGENLVEATVRATSPTPVASVEISTDGQEDVLVLA